MYRYTCVCIYIYIYMHVNVYTYIYIYIYMYRMGGDAHPQRGRLFNKCCCKCQTHNA